jgi:SAM-dependent methyltransferase
MVEALVRPSHPTPNHPTVSHPRTMQDFPDVRAAERDTLIELVDLQPGCSVLDVQAAGGFLADEVHRRLAGEVSIICLEPNPALRARLNRRYAIVDDPVEAFRSVSDASVEVALGLVALHHSRSHAATIAECHRVLRPGGQLALCDVPAGTRLAAWLDEFVAAHSLSGHDGNFPALGSMARHCRRAGFVGIVEEVRDVPWRFARRPDIALFFQGLFGLSADIATIERAIADYFVVREHQRGCEVDWQLAYVRAAKAG